MHMHYLNWLLGHKCDACPRSRVCADHEKAACPGPGGSPRPTPPQPRLALETLEAREVFSVNPIVAENLLPGNPKSEWDLANGGDSNIEGFATDISVNHGQTVDF